MDSGVRRQLPSWMIRTTATEIEKTSTLETKVEKKENDLVEPHIKVVKPRKKAQTKINDIGTPLVDSKLQTLENCKAKTTKRKLKNHEKSQGDRYQEDESHPLKPCKESRKKRMLDKHCEDRVDDALESDKDKKVKGLVRKRVVEEAFKKKQSKKLKTFHKGTTEYNSSEDELTVEDLVSIAKEVVEANRKEFQKSKDLEFKTKTESAHRADCQVSSENQLTSYRESDSVTDRPLASDSSLSKRESTERSNSNLNTTDDGGSLSMIDLLMGHLLKKSEEVERKTDAINDKFMLDYQLSKGNQIENLSEVVPVSKKSNFKDKVRELLD